MNKNSPAVPGKSILIGVGALVLLAVLVTVALTRSNVRTYALGTPEATAQAYIQALLDEDLDTAHSYLSDDLKAVCKPRDLEMWWVRNADSATFDEVRSDGFHAEIELSLLSRNYDLGLFLFDNYDYSRETELVLDRFGNEWLVTDATWPLAGCNWR